MLKIKLSRNYKSAKGNTVFVYTVTGTVAELESYKTAQAENFRLGEDGSSLWFITRCVGPNGTLIITEKGKVIPDMSAYEQAASIAKQFGGNFGQELARASVAQLLGNHPSSDENESAPAKKAIGQM